MRKFIEITSDIDDHGGKGWEYGSYLFSPSKSDDGKDIYSLMREPVKNDLIIHFFDEGAKRNSCIHGISFVKKSFYETREKPTTKTRWEDADSYYKIDLKDFKKFKNPIPLKEFYSYCEDDIRHELATKPLNYPFQETKPKDPRYKVDSFVGLVNGKYLRECTNELFSLIKEVEDIEGKDSEENQEKSSNSKGDYLEGRRKVKESTFFARNPNLKKDAIKERGYKCEACEFLFADKYGKFGADYIECHHENPLSERPEKDWTDELKTSIEEVKLLCSNCHRMIHHTRPAKKFHTLLLIMEDSKK